MRFRRKRAFATTLSAVILGALAVSAATASAADSNCDVYAAPAPVGNDSNPGTATAPVATIQRLLAIVPAGTSDADRGVACVHAGTYDFSGALEATVSKPWNTLRPVGTASALIGRLVVGVNAHHAIVEGLTLNGYRPNQPANPSLLVYGDGSIVRDNEITNDHTEICVHVTDYFGNRTSDVTIEGNDIHDCGAPPHANHDHGIYLANADRTRIVDNYIHDNQDRGIQLWPDADNSLIEGNVIDDNAQGILIGSNSAPAVASDSNTIRFNAITDSNANFEDPDGPGPIQENKHGWNVEFFWHNGVVGSGNVVAANCLRANHPNPHYESNAGINLSDSGWEPEGFTVAANTLLPPAIDLPAYPQCSEESLRALSDPEKNISCEPASPSSWQGGAGADSYTGTPIRDHADALGGNDTLHGAGSGDCLYGSAGADSLDGEGAPDHLLGGIGADTVIGREAAETEWSPDEIVCGPDADVAYADITDTVAGDCERTVYNG